MTQINDWSQIPVGFFVKHLSCSQGVYEYLIISYFSSASRGGHTKQNSTAGQVGQKGEENDLDNCLRQKIILSSWARGVKLRCRAKVIHKEKKKRRPGARPCCAEIKAAPETTAVFQRLELLLEFIIINISWTRKKRKEIGRENKKKRRTLILLLLFEAILAKKILILLLFLVLYQDRAFSFFLSLSHLKEKL